MRHSEHLQGHSISAPSSCWPRVRRKLALALVASMPVLGCGSTEELTPTEKLAERFGDNFNPNDYGHFADSAYEISNKRDPSPDSPIKCKGQDETVVDQKELIDYLIACKSRQRVVEFLNKMKLDQNAPNEPKPTSEAERSEKITKLQASRYVKADTITLDDDVFKIYALLGKDPELYTAFMKSVVTYRGWDMNPEDTFRHPISTLRSGWTDCDDWAVEHYFWAHLHDLSPNLVIALKPEDTAAQQGTVKTVNAHSFVTYHSPESGKTVVLDNQHWTELEAGETLEGYLEENFPDEDLTIEFNGPFVDKKEK